MGVRETWREWEESGEQQQKIEDGDCNREIAREVRIEKTKKKTIVTMATSPLTTGIPR